MSQNGLTHGHTTPSSALTSGEKSYLGRTLSILNTNINHQMDKSDHGHIWVEDHVVNLQTIKKDHVGVWYLVAPVRNEPRRAWQVERK